MRREHNTPSLLPSGYRQLEYLESTTTTYIDTQYYENSQTNILTIRTKVWSDFSYRDTFDMIGNIYNYDNGSKICGINTNGCFLYYKPYGTRILVQCPNIAGNELTYTFNKTTQKCSIYNGSSTYTGYYNGLKNNSSFVLFWRGYNDINLGDLSPLPGRIFYLQIDADGTLVRDYIPALRLLDNKPGMYDLVNNQFYTNAGTGEFLYA